MHDPDADARKALRLIGPDPQNWVPDRPGIDHNVVIVGGGQSGSAFAFALRRAGIGKVSVIDMAEDEARAGVWLNAARMNVLRTPKTLPGPEYGIAALSFQAWYEARHGEAAYAAIERIPRADWAEYLAWYRRFLGIPVRYRTRLRRIEPADGHFRLHLELDGAAKLETARKIILANGVAGNGGAYIPTALTDGLPAHLYAHTADAIDFSALRGKKVAVVGGAASAFDAAGAALEDRGGVGRPVRTPSRARLAAGWPGARLSRRLRQFSRIAGRGALASGDPLPPCRIDAACRRDRAGPKVPEFPSASRRAVAVGARRGGPDRGAGGRRGV